MGMQRCEDGERKEGRQNQQDRGGTFLVNASYQYELDNTKHQVLMFLTCRTQ